MNRALFVTTATSEPIENVRAWQHNYGEAEHVVFDINGPPQDEHILARAQIFAPDIIFYIGGESGSGLPAPELFRALRAIAPTVQIQGDMADPPWHEKLQYYREQKCFDLHVGMDGVPTAPVDHCTLTPFDLARFPDGPSDRPIPCGFPGNFVPLESFVLRPQFGDGQLLEEPRGGILHRVQGLTLRLREPAGSYDDYVKFMRHCRMVLNTPWAGSGAVYHVKGRVLEAAFSGCALLELRGSPTELWFPPETYFTYADADEATTVISSTPAEEVARRAALFAAHAREHYTPKKIYDGIIQRL